VVDAKEEVVVGINHKSSPLSDATRCCSVDWSTWQCVHAGGLPVARTKGGACTEVHSQNTKTSNGRPTSRTPHDTTWRLIQPGLSMSAALRSTSTGWLAPKRARYSDCMMGQTPAIMPTRSEICHLGSPKGLA